MADDQLEKLFAGGTAPERDAAFTRRVDARIALERRGIRLAANVVRALVILMFAAAVFVIIRELEPVLQPTIQSSQHFMGVPLPLILTVIGIGVAFRLWLSARRRSL